MTQKKHPTPPQILSNNVVAKSRLFTVESLELKFSNNEERQYERIRGGGRGAVMIVPLSADNELLLVREYCAGTNNYQLGFPKGLIDPGETPEQAANILIQARQAGLEGDTILAGDSGAGSQKLIDAGGSAVDGMLFPASFVSSASDSSIAFSAAYETAYGKAPDLWAATGYTMMQTVANAIRNAGEEVNRETLREAMAATKDLPVIMGQGLLSFDENRIPSMGGIVMQLKNGAWVAP